MNIPIKMHQTKKFETIMEKTTIVDALTLLALLLLFISCFITSFTLYQDHDCIIRIDIWVENNICYLLYFSCYYMFREQLVVPIIICVISIILVIFVLIIARIKNFRFSIKLRILCMMIYLYFFYATFISYHTMNFELFTSPPFGMMGFII